MCCHEIGQISHYNLSFAVIRDERLVAEVSDKTGPIPGMCTIPKRKGFLYSIPSYYSLNTRAADHSDQLPVHNA